MQGSFLDRHGRKGNSYHMTDHFMEDHDSALSSGGLPDPQRRALNAFAAFLRSQAHVLTRYPDLAVQQAANGPDGSAPCDAALRILASGREKRLWWRWINKVRKETPVMRLGGHTSSVYWCSFSPDGRRLISVGWDGVRLWQFPSGQQSALDPVLNDRAFYVCYTEQGIWIQQRKNARQLNLLESQSLQGLNEWTVPVMEVLSRIAISPDNRFLAVIDGKNVELFDPLTHQRIQALSMQEESAHSSASHGSFRQDGEMFAAIDPVGSIHVWETKDWQKILTRKSEAVDLRTCALSPDGRIIALSRPEGVLCEDLQTGKPLAIYRGHSGGVEGCCFSPDGNHVITWGRDKSILVWTPPDPAGEAIPVPEEFKDFTTKKSGFQTTKWHAAFLPSCAISPDGSFSILTDSASGVHVLNETATKRIRKIRNLYTDLSGQGQFPGTFAFSSDTKMLACGENTGEVQLFLLDRDGEDRPISLEEPHAYKVTACSFSPDGSTLLTVSEDRTYHLYQMRTRKLIRSVRAHDAGVTGCSFLQDGSLFVTVSDDGTARIWTTRKGELLHTLPAEAGLLCCSLSTDRNLLLAGSSDGAIRVWDMKDMVLDSVLHPHTAAVRGCWFSEDPRRIVAAYNDGWILLVDADSGVPRGVFPAEGGLCCASFCAGMDRILLTTKENSLYLLSLENSRRSHAGTNL